jgi:hypothetical protein
MRKRDFLAWHETSEVFKNRTGLDFSQRTKPLSGQARKGTIGDYAINQKIDFGKPGWEMD